MLSRFLSAKVPTLKLIENANAQSAIDEDIALCASKRELE